MAGKTHAADTTARIGGLICGVIAKAVEPPRYRPMDEAVATGRQKLRQFAQIETGPHGDAIEEIAVIAWKTPA